MIRAGGNFSTIILLDPLLRNCDDIDSSYNIDCRLKCLYLWWLRFLPLRPFERFIFFSRGWRIHGVSNGILRCDPLSHLFHIQSDTLCRLPEVVNGSDILLSSVEEWGRWNIDLLLHRFEYLQLSVRLRHAYLLMRREVNIVQYILYYSISSIR